MSISAIILTCNNEKIIARCICSLKNIVDEVILIDDYSSDNTIKNALNEHNETIIYQRRLNDDFAEQRNFGISKASFNNILMIDSDEFLGKDLQSEILAIKSKLNAKDEYTFWAVRRNYSFVGFSDEKYRSRPIMFDKSNYFIGKIHEKMKLRPNQKQFTGILHHKKSDYDLRSFFDEQLKYADVKAISPKFGYAKMILLFFLTFTKFYFVRGYVRFGAAGFSYSVTIALTPLLAILIKHRDRKDVLE